ncbi:MAG: hypothetical protein J7K00_03565 [Candidatus Diapherotrites archaeon]|nr:hypothetical protein [Candidatus Diapherotrites archaeon]
MKNNTFRQAVIKAGKGLWGAFPMILGTILLISLISTLIPKLFYTNVFSKNIILNSFIGSLVGSISAGNPITSYIFGGELLTQGISLLAVTAFLVAWVTVGLIQLPAESAVLGKKFALLRNASSFILAMIVAIITVSILGVL